jgi:hypothetical protein
MQIHCGPLIIVTKLEYMLSLRFPTKKVTHKDSVSCFLKIYYKINLKGYTWIAAPTTEFRFAVTLVLHGADKSLALQRKQQATALKNVFTPHIPPSPLSFTQLWLRCSNFFNPSKENSFGYAANRCPQLMCPHCSKTFLSLGVSWG